MSSNQQSSYSSTSYSYTSSSMSSSSGGGGQSQVSGTRSAQQVVTDASGNTHVQSAHQNLGQPAVMETRSYDSAGRQLVDGGSSDAGGTQQRKIVDVSHSNDLTQAEIDALYEERIEDEYAKREGGA